MRPDDSRSYLLMGLNDRRDEIFTTIVARVHAIEPPPVDAEQEYLEGLRQAIQSAIVHTIAADAREDELAPVPAPIIAQARLAAHRGIPFETVLRRYQAGHAVIGDFTAEEAERRRTNPGLLRQILRSQAFRTDRVIAAISAAYMQEVRHTRPPTIRERRAERVQRLLDGELVDPGGLEYDFERWHVSVVVRGGSDGERVVDEALRRVDARHLRVAAAEEVTAIWLGSKERIEPRVVGDLLADALPEDAWAGVSEASHGWSGWRLAHRQASAALSVAYRSTARLARYADVALLASVMHDELLTTSLHRLYLAPLEAGKDGGRALLETLSAYLDAEGSVTSAAAALGVSRNTVTNRLRTIEKRAKPISSARAADFKVALQLRALQSATERTIKVENGSNLPTSQCPAPGDDP